MKRLPKEDRAGLYITVIVHLTVIIVLLLGGLSKTLGSEDSFVLDFTKIDQIEKMQAEVERLQREIAFKQEIASRIDEMIAGGSTPVRNLAVDRSELKDDRGTDAKELYKDAERLAEDLKNGFEADEPAIETVEKEKTGGKEAEKKTYSGPSVASYELEGRKASKLAIPAYRCMGAGEVTVIIGVDNAGNVIYAKVDENVSDADGCLRNFAIRAARMSRFSASPSAPAKQMGNIVYKFIAQ